VDLEQVSVNIFKVIDVLWLPLSWFVVRPYQRWITLAFVLTCILTLRLQVELMDSTGFSFGFMHLMASSSYARGLVVYGAAIAIFLILAYLSPKVEKIIVFGAALSIYFAAFCTSMVLMTL